MRLHLIDYVLWLSAPALQLGVLVAMYRRGLYREYPCFFNYIVVQSLGGLALIAASGYSNYYYFYWTESTLCALLSFAVLHDLLKNGFQTSGAVTRLIGFLLAGTLVIVVATEMSSITVQRLDHLDTSTELIFRTHRLVQIAQGCLMILLVVLRKSLGISRRSLLFGITLGFGLFATASVLLTVAMSHQRFVSRVTLSRFHGVVHLLTCGIWLWYALAGSGSEHTYSWKRMVPA